MNLARTLAALVAVLTLSVPVLADDPPLDDAIAAFARARDDALAHLDDDPAAALGALDAAEEALRRVLASVPTGRLKEVTGPESPEESAHRRARERTLLLIADAGLAAGRASGDEARLARALEVYEGHIEQSPAGPDLLFHAYAQRVEALLALGRLDDAAARAEELTWVERPWDPEDPDERAALDALVLETYLRAVTLRVRALRLLDRPAEALAVADGGAPERARAGLAGETQSGSADDSSSREAGERSRRTHHTDGVGARPDAQGWRGHALGPALEVERARALHALGRGAEAAAALEAVAARGRAAPLEEQVVGLGTTRAGALACRTLADLDLAGGLPLDDAATAHDAGLGHLLAGRSEHALVAWKRVLALAPTPEARTRWIPVAADRAGKLLVAQERWLEAALTFEALLVLAPDAAPGEVARLALATATRATRQLGEELTGDGPAARLRRRVEAAVAASPGGAEVEAVARLEAAAELERAGRWAEAARAYEAVPTGSTERARALVRAGECLLRAKDSDLVGHARALLEEAIAADGAQAPRAACVLAEVELAAGRSDEALAALARGAPPPEDLLVRAARARARALLAAGRAGALDEALAAFRAVAARADDAHHAPFAVELAAALRAAAGERLAGVALPPDDAAEARRLLADAAEVVAAWAARPGAAGTLSPAQALWAARALLEGQRADEAVALYERALIAPSTRDDVAVWLRTRAELGLALLGRDPRAAWDALVAVRDAVVVRDPRGRVLATGALVERRLAGPFAARREGRLVQEYAHVITLRLDDGTTRAFVDVAPAEGGDLRFHAVEGERPPSGRVPGDERTLTLEGRRLPLVALGLERAACARWEQERDRRFLATEALAASAAARALLRGRDDAGWRRLAAALPGEPLDLALRRWEADLRALELSLALERWAQVASDLRMLELLGRGDPPPELRARLDAIRAAVAAR